MIYRDTYYKITSPDNTWGLMSDSSTLVGAVELALEHNRTIMKKGYLGDEMIVIEVNILKDIERDNGKSKFISSSETRKKVAEITKDNQVIMG